MKVSETGKVPAILAIILNWNNFQDSVKCIESLLTCGYPYLTVIVVDNCSTDDSLVRLKERFGQCTFVENEENLGFARGCNRGIRRALEDEDCRYVLLLNNDAVLQPGALDSAVAAAESDARIGLVGGKILKSESSRQLWYAGGAVSRLRGQAKSRGFEEIDRGQYDCECDTQFVTAAMMLIKREVLTSVGSLPEEYFFGVEEWDYSIAVRRAGFRLRYSPQFVGYHCGDGSHWNFDPKFVYNYYRNKLIFQEKYLSPVAFVLWRWLFVLYGKVVYPRKVSRTAIQYSFGRDVDFAGLRYALDCALRDHRKTALDERQLMLFASELKAKFHR